MLVTVDQVWLQYSVSNALRGAGQKRPLENFRGEVDPKRAQEFSEWIDTRLGYRQIERSHAIPGKKDGFFQLPAWFAGPKLCSFMNPQRSQIPEYVKHLHAKILHNNAAEHWGAVNAIPEHMHKSTIYKGLLFLARIASSDAIAVSRELGMVEFGTSWSALDKQKDHEKVAKRHQEIITSMHGREYTPFLLPTIEKDE